MLQCIFVVAASKSLALSQKEPKMADGFPSSTILIAFMIASSSGATIRYTTLPPYRARFGRLCMDSNRQPEGLRWLPGCH